MVIAGIVGIGATALAKIKAGDVGLEIRPRGGLMDDATAGVKVKVRAKGTIDNPIVTEVIEASTYETLAAALESTNLWEIFPEDSVTLEEAAAAVQADIRQDLVERNGGVIAVRLRLAEPIAA